MTIKTPLIYCAIDTDDLSSAINLAQQLSNTGCGIKLGLEFFLAQGMSGVKAIKDSFPNVSIFLDLKFHDIPNTVAGAIRSATQIGIDYINVHAAGGTEMMELAQKTLNYESSRINRTAPKLLAVTVLTSLNNQELEKIGQDNNPKNQVLRLAKLAKASGLAGVVCSAEEITILRNELGKDFILMVPGIRPYGTNFDDQKRVMTPEMAINLGATHLVIGRPITSAKNPEQAACDILKSVTNN